jgi:hypothetical protein
MQELTERQVGLEGTMRELAEQHKATEEALHALIATLERHLSNHS